MKFLKLHYFFLVIILMVVLLGIWVGFGLQEEKLPSSPPSAQASLSASADSLLSLLFAVDELKQQSDTSSPPSPSLPSESRDFHYGDHYARNEDAFLQQGLHDRPAFAYHTELGPLVTDLSRWGFKKELTSQEWEIQQAARVVREILQNLLLEGIVEENPFERGKAQQWEVEWKRLPFPPKKFFVGIPYTVFSETEGSQLTFPVALQTEQSYTEGYLLLTSCQDSWCSFGGFLPLLPLENPVSFSPFQPQTQFPQDLMHHR